MLMTVNISYALPHASTNATPPHTHLFFASEGGIFPAGVPQLIPSTSSRTMGSDIRSTLRRTVRMAASFIKLARDAADQPCGGGQGRGQIDTQGERGMKESSTA